MPVELIAAKIFYKKYFKYETYSDVFEKCCKYNDCIPEEILNCCKKSLRRIIPDRYEEMKKEKNFS